MRVFILLFYSLSLSPFLFVQYHEDVFASKCALKMFSANNKKNFLALLLFVYVLDGGCSSCSHSNTCIDGKKSSCAADPFAINC